MTKLYAILLCLVAYSTSSSQQTTNSAGGSGQSGNIILDWSVGELTLVSTVNNNNLVFTQGVLQGQFIVAPVFGGIAAGELIIFPNPTPGLLKLLTGFLQAGQLSLTLYDDQGKLLYQSNEAINSFGTRMIDLSTFSNGMYMLRAVFKPDGGEARKQSYKIVKIN